MCVIASSLMYTEAGRCCCKLGKLFAIYFEFDTDKEENRFLIPKKTYPSSLLPQGQYTLRPGGQLQKRFARTCPPISSAASGEEPPARSMAAASSEWPTIGEQFATATRVNNSNRAKQRNETER